MFRITFYFAKCKVYNPETDTLETLNMYYTRERILKAELKEKGLKLISYEKVPHTYDLSHKFSLELLGEIQNKMFEDIESNVNEKNVIYIDKKGNES